MAVESEAPEAVAPSPADQPSGIRAWFRALGRSLTTILVTLAVLAVLGFAADVVLHRVTHSSHSTTTYTGISEVEVVLDGDGAVSITGSAGGASAVIYSETDNATIFSHPQRTADLIGGTLYIAVHCSDALCSADLALTVPAKIPVTLRVGNALRLDRATVTVSGMAGPVDMTAWPARVTVSNSTSTVTGAVGGTLACNAPAVCDVRLVS